MSKIFLDTNVLVYAMDRSTPSKRKRARALIRSLDGKETQGVISTQVMQEFFVVATKKLGVDPLPAKAILAQFDHFETVVVDPPLIREAIDHSILNRLSFWDALILSSAKSAQCDKICSEDFSDGHTLGGIRVENPFK